MEDIFETTDDDDADEIPRPPRDTAAKNGAPAKKDQSAQKESDRRKRALIAMGKAKGFLTTDEVHEHLPEGGMSPAQMDDWLSAFSDEGIEVVDSPKSKAAKDPDEAPDEPGEDVEIVDAVEAKKDEDEPEEDADDSAAPVDPVRMYLRKMGLVALLTREGEVEISKRMEEGQRPFCRWC
jgi:RNA polymerase primary sigma factor